MQSSQTCDLAISLDKFQSGANASVFLLAMVAVAQLVEHRIVTPEVAGSKPVSHPICLCRRANSAHFLSAQTAASIRDLQCLL